MLFWTLRIHCGAGTCAVRVKFACSHLKLSFSAAHARAFLIPLQEVSFSFVQLPFLSFRCGTQSERLQATCIFRRRITYLFFIQILAVHVCGGICTRQSKGSAKKPFAFYYDTLNPLSIEPHFIAKQPLSLLFKRYYCSHVNSPLAPLFVYVCVVPHSVA